MKEYVLFTIAFLGLIAPAFGASVYPTRLEDSNAVYLAASDGKVDASAAIQAAIDKVQETTGWGIAFIPEGRYRITRTIYVWPGVRVIDAQTKEAIEFHGRFVFLCASTLESARIFLNSATPEFSNGLANSSGQVGKNLMDHIFKGGASGTIPGFEDHVQLRNRPNGIYVPRFRNVKEKHPEFLRGYGFQGNGARSGWERGSDMPGFGAEFKHALAKPGPWRVSFTGFGECLPNPDNYLEIDKEKLDFWGIPTLKIHCKWRQNELAIYKIWPLPPQRC